MASTVVVATEDEVEETFWLTYWSCFGILFLVMDWAEELLGSIPGFYSLCLVATVYLMLPLFRGADEVFRNILVPIAGQRDQLLIRDAHILHKEMVRQVPAERIDSVRAATIAAFMSTALQPARNKNDERLLHIITIYHKARHSATEGIHSTNRHENEE